MERKKKINSSNFSCHIYVFRTRGHGCIYDGTDPCVSSQAADQLSSYQSMVLGWQDEYYGETF